MHIKKRLAINFITANLSTLISIVVQLIAIPRLVYFLGLSYYSLYTLFLFFSLTSGLALFDFGIQGTLVKLLAEDIERGDGNMIRKRLINSLLLFSIMGIIAFVVVYFLLFFDIFRIASFFSTSRGLQIFSLLAALNIFFDFIFIFSSTILEAIMRKDIIDYLNVVKLLVYFIFVIFFIGKISETFEAVLYFTVGCNFCIVILSFIICYFLLGRGRSLAHLKFEFSFWEIRHLFALSRHLFVSRFVGFLDVQLPRILIGLILPINYVGLFDLAQRVVGVLRNIGGKISQVGLIAYSSALNLQGHKDKLNEVFLKATKYSILIVMPFIIICFCYTDLLMKYWLKSNFPELNIMIKFYLLQLINTMLINDGSVILVGINRVRIIIKLTVTLFITTTCISVFVLYFFNTKGLSILAWVSSLILTPLYLKIILHEFSISGKVFYNTVIKHHLIISILLFFIIIGVNYLYMINSILVFLCAITFFVLSYYIIYFFKGLTPTDHKQLLLTVKSFFRSE